MAAPTFQSLHPQFLTIVELYPPMGHLPFWLARRYHGYRRAGHLLTPLVVIGCIGCSVFVAIDGRKSTRGDGGWPVFGWVSDYLLESCFAGGMTGTGWRGEGSDGAFGEVCSTASSSRCYRQRRQLTSQVNLRIEWLQAV